MDAERFRRVAEIMKSMRDGDRAAVFTLAAEFGGDIASAMRSHLRAVGVGAVARSDLDALVVDACLVLWQIGGGWDAGHATVPWTWARRRLRRLAADYVGQWCDRFDAEEVELGTGRSAIGSWAEVGTNSEPEPLEVLGGLAAGEPLCALLHDALAAVGSTRDQSIVLELALQHTLGDPSPALTVAGMHGMQAAAVRQVWHRVRARLRTLAEADERYAPLAGLALLAA